MIVSYALKRLTLDDMDRAAVVFRTSFDQRLPWLAGLHTPDEDREFWRDRIFPQCEVWGAADDDIRGVIAFREGMIDQLYVLPSCQGRGIGSALLNLAQATSACLSLWTFQRNTRARLFYEARGFVEVKRTDGSGNEEREPDVLYQWNMPSEPRASSAEPGRTVQGCTVQGCTVRGRAGSGRRPQE